MSLVWSLCSQIFSKHVDHNQSIINNHLEDRRASDTGQLGGSHLRPLLCLLKLLL